MTICSDIRAMVSGSLPNTSWEVARPRIYNALQGVTKVICVQTHGVVPASTPQHMFLEVGWPDGPPDFEDAATLMVLEGSNVWIGINDGNSDLGTIPATPGTGVNWSLVNQPSPADTQIPVGATMWTGAAVAPTGWLVADGSAVSRTNYADLFSAIGENFGPGDGSTTFNLPDLRQRGIIGVGSVPGMTARTLGQIGGSESHQLSEAELPAHNHSQKYHDVWPNISNGSYSFALKGGAYSADEAKMKGDSTGSAGSNLPHNNMQPYTVMTPIIKY